MSGDTARYGIDELAELGGVSRRTVRYYVQEQLLPPPLGVGRGRHYGRAHLDALLRVKSMQEAGLTLEAVHHALSSRSAAPLLAREAFGREVWRRLALAPGLELHVRSDVRVPPASALAALSEWCRIHLGRSGDRHHADD